MSQRVVVTGATGNVGTSVLEALEAEPDVESVLGLARRPPADNPWSKVSFAAADITGDDLDAHCRGADVLLHLAWAIQPARDEGFMWRTNVEGTARLLAAAARTGVGAVVFASSVGAYSPGPKDRRVDESWPTHGVPTSAYARQKAYVERMLDVFEAEHPGIRVVRMRPGLLLKRDAASEIGRLFLGPLAGLSLGRGCLPVFPDAEGLCFQVAHSTDAGRAFAAAAVRPVRGAFNLAAEPALDGAAMARLLGARAVRVKPGLLRFVAAASWRARLQPTDPGWVDLVLSVPLLDTTRARRELDWEPALAATDTVGEMLEGLSDRDGSETAPLAPS